MTAPGDVLVHAASASLGVPPWGDAPSLPPGDLPATGDVLIVGAGITGLTAAMALASAGRDVTVIERAFGSGASSRSGGIVLGNTLGGPTPGFDDCHERLRNWVSETASECDLVWNGCLELARDRTLRALPIDWRAEGIVRVGRRMPGGVLNPLRLQHALLTAALRAGATLVNGVTLATLARRGPSPLLLTDRGPIIGQQVIMAVDATARTAAFDPWSERLITVALQTAPLTPAALAAIGLTVHQSFYTRDLPLLWGRVMPDRSLVVGRETLEWSLIDSDTVRERFGEASARLVTRVRRLHPELVDAEVLRIWGGPVARSAAGVPAMVADPDHPGVTWVGGYGGHGIAQAFRMGQLVAEQLNRLIGRVSTS